MSGVGDAVTGRSLEHSDRKLGQIGKRGAVPVPDELTAGGCLQLSPSGHVQVGSVAQVTQETEPFDEGSLQPPERTRRPKWLV